MFTTVAVEFSGIGFETFLALMMFSALESSCEQMIPNSDDKTCLWSCGESRKSGLSMAPACAVDGFHVNSWHIGLTTVEPSHEPSHFVLGAVVGEARGGGYT